MIDKLHVQNEKNCYSRYAGIPENLLFQACGQKNLIPSLGFKPPAFVNIILDSWASTPSF